MTIPGIFCSLITLKVVNKTNFFKYAQEFKGRLSFQPPKYKQTHQEEE